MYAAVRMYVFLNPKPLQVDVVLVAKGHAAKSGNSSIKTQYKFCL